MKQSGVLPFPPEKCSKVILACACLHNIAIRAGLANDEEDEDQDEDESDSDSDDENPPDDRQGMQARRELIANFSTRGELNGCYTAFAKASAD